MHTNEVRQSRQASAWDQFLLSSRPDIGFLQSSWWADFQAGGNWGHFGVVFRDGDDICGGARVFRRPFEEGKCYYYIPEGPVLPANEGDAKQIYQATLAYIDRKRGEDPNLVTHLRLEPRWISRPAFVGEGCREAGSWIEPRNTLHIDLGLSKADLLAQMKPKGRYNIGVARKHGVLIVEDLSSRGLADFLKIYAETVERHGLRGNRTAYFEDLFDMLGEHLCGSVYFAEYQDKRIATALIIYFGDRATYLFGGSTKDYRRTMAPYLLHFEAILEAKARGYRWYDFYGIAPQDKVDHKWAGISVFKRKFGGVELSFVPALDQIYDAVGYEEFRRRKSKKNERIKR